MSHIHLFCRARPTPCRAYRVMTGGEGFPSAIEVTGGDESVSAEATNEAAHTRVRTIRLEAKACPRGHVIIIGAWRSVLMSRWSALVRAGTPRLSWVVRQYVKMREVTTSEMMADNGETRV